MMTDDPIPLSRDRRGSDNWRKTPSRIQDAASSSRWQRPARCCGRVLIVLVCDESPSSAGDRPPSGGVRGSSPRWGSAKHPPGPGLTERGEVRC